MLAIALSAFFLTKDEPACEAVYDASADKEQLLDWLVPVRGGNTADELSKVGFATMILPAIALQGIGEAYQTIRRHAPLAFILIALMSAYGAYKVPRPQYVAALRGLGYAAEIFMASRTRYEDALGRFATMAPAVPS